MNAFETHHRTLLIVPLFPRPLPFSHTAHALHHLAFKALLAANSLHIS